MKFELDTQEKLFEKIHNEVNKIDDITEEVINYTRLDTIKTVLKELRNDDYLNQTEYLFLLKQMTKI